MALAGATVTGVARSDPDGGNLPPSMSYRKCDVTDARAFSQICAVAAEAHGSIDVLVNAAGISLPNSLEQDAVDRFERTIAVDLSGVYRCSLEALQHMSRGASIINVTSINSILGFPDNPGYVAAKGGLRMLTRALAVDYGQRGIRVNNLAPGYIRTSMTEKSWSDTELSESRVRHTLLDRWGESSDLVGAAIFLASDASSYVTGQDVVVDGGWTAKGLVR